MQQAHLFRSFPLRSPQTRCLGSAPTRRLTGALQGFPESDEQF